VLKRYSFRISLIKSDTRALMSRAAELDRFSRGINGVHGNGVREEHIVRHHGRIPRRGYIWYPQDSARSLRGQAGRSPCSDSALGLHHHRVLWAPIGNVAIVQENEEPAERERVQRSFTPLAKL